MLDSIGELTFNEKAKMLFMTNPTTLSAYSYRNTMKVAAVKKIQSRPFSFISTEKENFHICSKTGNLVSLDFRLNETQRTQISEPKEDNDGVYWASDIHSGYILFPSGKNNLVFLRVKDKRKKTLKEVWGENERVRRATYCVVTKRLLMLLSSKTQEIKHLRMVDFLEKKKHSAEFSTSDPAISKGCRT